MAETQFRQRLSGYVPSLDGFEAVDEPQQMSRLVLQWMAETSLEKAVQTLQMTLKLDPEDRDTDSSLVHAVVVGMIRKQQRENVPPLSAEILADFWPAFEQSHALPGFQSLLLRCLVANQSLASLRLFAELFVSEHALDTRFCMEIFSDLLKLASPPTEAMFPGLLQGLNNPRVAPFVLDYANFVFRKGLVLPHPASQQIQELTGLLSKLSERLGAIQDIRPETDDEARRLGKQVTEAVSLGVSLCDALACIGDPIAVGALNKALGVEHRRLRVEAAAALAKLDVEDAKSLLAAMAADPIERLRVLKYAEELELLDSVADEHCNIVAQAEAEFVTYLAQPTQFGIAPQHVELVDQRELAWPGYEEPRNCFLFQFVYQFESGEFSNIGIAGPLVRAVQADVRHLPFDDVYALFAGWHVDHPDILAIEAARTVGQDQRNLNRLTESLLATEYEDIQPILLAKLLEQVALIASVSRGDQDGWAIVSEDAVSWVSLGSPNSPLGAEDMFHLFVGRSLLRFFN